MSSSEPGRRPTRYLPAALAALVMLSLSCAVAPIAYHDGLPAATPVPGVVAARVAYSRAYWNIGDTWQRPMPYLSGGVRLGQDWRGLSFEQGLSMQTAEPVRAPCLQLGVGLRRPSVTLRALSMFNTDFDPLHWWQLSLLAGTGRRTSGFGFSGGARASKLAIGPVVVTDYSPFRDLTLRLEGSLMFPPPWQDERVQGRVLTIGLVAEPSGSYRQNR